MEVVHIRQMIVLRKELNNISYMPYKACKTIFKKYIKMLGCVACIFVNYGFLKNTAEGVLGGSVS